MYETGNKKILAVVLTSAMIIGGLPVEAVALQEGGYKLKAKGLL